MSITCSLFGMFLNTNRYDLLKEDSMLQQYKIAFYVIIVALVAVLLLFTTVTAQESALLPQGQQGIPVFQVLPGVPDTSSSLTAPTGAPNIAHSTEMAPKQGITSWVARWAAILATKCAIPAGWHHLVGCDKYYAVENQKKIRHSK
jgi:hypothetical protein